MGTCKGIRYEEGDEEVTFLEQIKNGPAISYGEEIDLLEFQSPTFTITNLVWDVIANKIKAVEIDEELMKLESSGRRGYCTQRQMTEKLSKAKKTMVKSATKICKFLCYLRDGGKPYKSLSRLTTTVMEELEKRRGNPIMYHHVRILLQELAAVFPKDVNFSTVTAPANVSAFRNLGAAPKLESLPLRTKEVSKVKRNRSLDTNHNQDTPVDSFSCHDTRILPEHVDKMKGTVKVGKKPCQKIAHKESSFGKTTSPKGKNSVEPYLRLRRKSGKSDESKNKESDDTLNKLGLKHEYKKWNWKIPTKKRDPESSSLHDSVTPSQSPKVQTSQVCKVPSPVKVPSLPKAQFRQPGDAMGASSLGKISGYFNEQKNLQSSVENGSNVEPRLDRIPADSHGGKPPDTNREIETCCMCGKEALGKCHGCHARFYCSPSCQAIDGHRNICRKRKRQSGKRTGASEGKRSPVRKAQQS